MLTVSQLFVALSTTLNNHVKAVTIEKDDLLDEASTIVTTIRQMEASLDDNRHQRSHHSDSDDLKVTYPLNRCLVALKEKHMQISKLHRERFEQVKSELHCPPYVDPSCLLLMLTACKPQSWCKPWSRTRHISSLRLSRSPCLRQAPTSLYRPLSTCRHPTSIS